MSLFIITSIIFWSFFITRFFDLDNPILKSIITLFYRVSNNLVYEILLYLIWVLYLFY